MTETDILRRCCESPVDHLAETSLTHFQAYTIGYGFQATLACEDMDEMAFHQAVKEDYAIQGDLPMNVATRGFLEAAEGAERGLSKYLAYRERLAKPLSQNIPSKTESNLLEVLASHHTIRKRPAMFFGNDASCAHIWSLISGCRWAEMDSQSGPGMAGAFEIQFQQWVEARFPFSKGIPWHRTFYFVCLGSSERSLKAFFDFFDLFQAGAQPDCLSKTGRNMMNNIADICGVDPSGLEEDIKRIAPI